MCGVVAMVADHVSISQLECASSAIAHRGPDARGAWIAPSRRCGLASRRLSFNDLQGGDQPLVSPQGGLTAVVNGEFYDFQAIRKELLDRGHSFATRSDSEILLPLYRERGVACLARLRGEFAFALWDENAGRLFAARDRFGIKPLFYAWVGHTLVFASEIKALFAAGHEPKWDREHFIDHMMLCHGPSGSLFHGVRQVPPGHYAIVQGGTITLHRYWDIDFPERQKALRSANMDDLVGRLREELDEAVRLRLQADVQVGSFLSGGLDSAAVVGLAVSGGARPTTFTVQFDQPEYDESTAALETADFNGVPSVAIPMTFSDLAAAWERTVWHAESTYDNARGIARLLQCDAVRSVGCKAVLSGEGADEILAGYFFARQDYLRSVTTGIDRDLIEQGASNTPLVFQSAIAGQATQTIDALEAAIGFTPSWIYGAITHRGGLVRELLNGEYRLEAATDSVIARLLSDLGGLDGLADRHPVHQSLYLWIKTFLPNMILVIDRLEMAAPIESRVPFLDHRFVETARDIPIPLLYGRGLEKYPLRLAVQDRLTDAVFSRAKQPFTAPHALRAGKNPMKDFIGDILHSESFRDCPFFDRRLVCDKFNKWITQGGQVSLAADQAMMLLTHVSLLQRHFSPSV